SQKLECSACRTQFTATESRLQQPIESQPSLSFDHHEPEGMTPETHSVSAVNPLSVLGISFLFLWLVTWFIAANVAEEKGTVAIVFIILGVAGIIFWRLLGSTQCPNCKRMFVRQHLKSYLLDRTEGYKTVTRYQKNTRGETISSWPEQVQVV